VPMTGTVPIPLGEVAQHISDNIVVEQATDNGACGVGMSITVGCHSVDNRGAGCFCNPIR